MKHTPIYTHDSAYAIEHDEIKQYRESYQANVACKNAIEKAIDDNYSDNRFNSKTALEQVEESFSRKTIAYVLANTIQHKEWDERICRENKDWAKSIEVCPDRTIIIGKSHSGLIDLFTSRFVAEKEKEKGKR